MARDWRRYAKHLEAMLAAEKDMLRTEVRSAVVIELHSRGWVSGPQLRELADAVAERVAQTKEPHLP